MIDTHAHLDGEEFADDRAAVLRRAREAGVERIFIPAINIASCHSVVALHRQHPDYLFPMLGLHPEEVRADYRDHLAQIHAFLVAQRAQGIPVVAIGEIGLDFYWSREYEQEQLAACREQIEWAVELQLPLMIHCRKAQNELLHLLRDYKDDLVGGVFHCFTGNEQEAQQLLAYDRFLLGIGGVLTFKKSHLPTVLHASVPLSRIVLETDAPYMAPVPMRGQRNESAYVRYVQEKVAEAYGTTEEAVCQTTNDNVRRLFHV